MKKRVLLAAGLIAFSVATITSCSDDDIKINSDVENEISIVDETSSSDIDGDVMVLGEELEDPYNLANMQKALESLNLSKSGVVIDELTPTHTYWRFLPKNEDELYELTSDTTITFYEYPLNYEIVEDGSFYHDSTLADTAITWQYAVIPINHPIIDNIEHEKLYDVFLPPEDNEDTELSKRGLSREFYEELEDRSMVLTGVVTESISKKSKRWTPSGFISVWDDKIGGYIPLEGAQVHARHFTHCAQGLTSSTGWFKVDDSFKYQVHYGIKWERGKYDIRRGLFQSWYKRDGKTKGSWNCYIKGGKGQAMATILRAANKMLYGDNLGLVRPGYSTKKIKINFAKAEGTSHFCPSITQTGFDNDIKIFAQDANGYRMSEDIFRCVTHEFGHFIHYKIMDFKFFSMSKYISESWAVAVGYAMTKDEYAKRGITLTDDDASFKLYHKQYWPDNGEIEYTPMMVDLMDDFNESVKIGIRHPYDNITGYTIKEIQDEILPYSYGVSSFKNRLKAVKLHGETDNDIDELVKLY